MSQGFWLLVFLLILNTPLVASDIQILEDRLSQAAFLDNQSLELVDSLLDEMSSSGRFDDVSYFAGEPSISKRHLQRLQILASAYNDVDHPKFQDSLLANKVYEGIKVWVELNIQEPNWWHRTIDYPKKLWPSVILMKDYLAVQDSALLEEAGQYLTWGWEAAGPGYKTGANLTDILQGLIPGAVILNEPQELVLGLSALEDDLSFSSGDGIHQDFTFSQHTGTGLQLYMGGYGNVYADGVTLILSYMNGLAWMVSEAAMDRFDGFIYTGVQWSTWGSLMDYSVMGRSIARKGASTIGRSYKRSLERWAIIRPGRLTETNEWIQRMSQGVDGTGPLGAQYFWRHDFQVHREVDWMSSVRMTSTRTVGSESGNGEAIMNYHMGDGVHFIYRRGDEYQDIFPVWDWHKIPGVTTRQHGDNFPLSTWGVGGLGNSPFAGGVGNTESSIAAFIYDKESVQAYKSWFTFPGKIIALGAGIQSDLNDAPVYTTLQQSLFQFEPLVAANNGDDQWIGDSISVEGTALVWHDSIGYHILDSAQIEIRVEERSGSWNRINTNLSSETVVDSVFSLWIDHGKQPNQSQYAYAIYPSIALADAREKERNPGIDVLQNTPSIQAVYDSSSATLGVVFYQASTLWLDQERRIYSARPQAMLVQDYGDSLSVQISNPDQSASVLRFFITGEWQGEGVVEYRDSLDQTVVQVPAPTGMLAGSAVSIQLTRISNEIDFGIHTSNLLNFTYWTTREDQVGSETELTQNDSSVSARFTMAESLSWASLSGAAVKDFSGTTHFMIRYSATDSFRFVCSQSDLQTGGLSYGIDLPAAIDTTVYVDVSELTQPSWISESQKADLDLSKVTNLLFQPQAKGAESEFTLTHLKASHYVAEITTDITSREVPPIQEISWNGSDLEIIVEHPGMYQIEVLSVGGRRLYMDTQELKQGRNTVSLKLDYRVETSFVRLNLMTALMGN